MSEFAYIPFSEILIRLGAAAGLAFLIGLERELKGKSFGLRTHILLSLGTAAFVIIAMELTYSLAPSDNAVTVDPIRVVDAIIAGISFLGMGSVIRSDDSIMGATTGAGIWVLGCIGFACGLGLYFFAAIITLMVLVVVVALNPFDQWLKKRLTDSMD
jgi:putative Mg2+ transporter-C (MgtC) family protein